MSNLNVNKISAVGSGSTVTIAGIASVTNNISAGSSVTATTFYGDGSNLTGISVDSTKIETGNTKVETIDTGSDGHVKVTTEGSERLRITPTGLVGIGTDNPSYPLSVVTSSGKSSIEIRSYGTGANDDVFLRMQPAGTAKDCFIDFGDDDDADVGGIRYNHSSDFMTFTTNANERLRITSEGYVTGNVNVPCWFGSQDTQHNITTGTWMPLLNLGNSVINPTLNNGGWNESTGTFTAQTGQAGYYYCYGCAGIDDVQDADIVYCGISVNGATPIFLTENRALDQSANIILGGVMVAQVVQLAVGDTVQLRVYHNEGSTEPTEPNRCFFGGYRLAI